MDKNVCFLEQESIFWNVTLQPLVTELQLLQAGCIPNVIKLPTNAGIS
jgi:hypothetical protein